MRHALMPRIAARNEVRSEVRSVAAKDKYSRCETEHEATRNEDRKCRKRSETDHRDRAEELRSESLRVTRHSDCAMRK